MCPQHLLLPFTSPDSDSPLLVRPMSTAADGVKRRDSGNVFERFCQRVSRSVAYIFYLIVHLGLPYIEGIDKLFQSQRFVFSTLVIRAQVLVGCG